jgi:hypothetical protein
VYNFDASVVLHKQYDFILKQNGGKRWQIYPPFTKGGLSKLNHEVTLINFLVIYGT